MFVAYFLLAMLVAAIIRALVQPVLWAIQDRREGNRRKFIFDIAVEIVIIAAFCLTFTIL